MKTIKMIFPVAALAVTTLTVNASTTWIETKFWKAPVAREMKAALIPQGNLSSDCEGFRKVMYAADGTPSWITKYPEKVARFRRAIDPAGFEIESGTNLRIETKVEVDVEVSDENFLPHFLQRQAVTSVSLDEIGEVEVKADTDSLTAISQNLNLEDTTVEFRRNASGKLMIDLKGLDLACDLLNGKAHLEGTVPASVYIDSDASEKLHDFYNEKLMSRIRDLFQGERNTRVLRAVRIGHRIGTLLEQVAPDTDEKRREKKMEALFTTLFHPETLVPTRNVVEVSGKKLIHIDSSVETSSVLIRLEN